MDNLREYINKLRYDFKKDALNERDVDADPLKQFEHWFKQAVDAKLLDPNAFVLSTASASGKPSARILLMRNFEQRGFVFYTNYNSRKGNDIQENPYATMLFFWPELERQVRIEGILEKQSAKESDDYFNSRPRESQLGAWASEQSKVIPDRAVLDEHVKTAEAKFAGKPVPRPPYWGGYFLKPYAYEFWQGRPSRLHDRIYYSKENHAWSISRLSP